MKHQNKADTNDLNNGKENQDNNNSEKKDRRAKKEESFFYRTGIFITKHYKQILLVWLVLLAGSIYPALQLRKVLSYNEMEFLPKNLEYNTGEEIREELFPSNATGNTIIVIESDNPISSSENMLYIQTLTERVEQEYNESIAQIQSVLSILQGYNNSYWQMIEEMENNLEEKLPNEIAQLNQFMYSSKNELEQLWSTIANSYSLTWFNFTRTYYYGLFDTDLFENGPSSTSYNTIFTDTNFTTDWAIPANYVDLVYATIIEDFSNPAIVDDPIMHELSLTLTNHSLSQALTQEQNMTIETYTKEVYPLLTTYYQNWSQIFYQNITSEGMTIINGTNYYDNLYSNTSLMEAYTSQETVLNQLQGINQTTFSSFNRTSYILNETLGLLDFSTLINEASSQLQIPASQIRAKITPLFPSFLAQIYSLGSNPETNTINDLANSFTDQVITELIELQPPPDSIEDIPSFLSCWVLSEDKKTSLILINYNGHNKTEEEIEEMVHEADIGIGKLAHELEKEMGLTETRIYHTGDQYVFDTWIDQAKEDASLIDLVTVLLVIVILLIIFCSLVAPIIPLVAIGSSIALSMAFLWFISFGMDIHFMATLFLTVTSLGAGVDYCIFIFSRYAEERKKGYNKDDALVTAVSFAGESVFHSGLTVMVGFGAMIIPNFPLLRILGIAMCIGISISMISAILVVPSIILLLGDKIWWPKVLQTILRPQKWFRKNKEEEEEEEEEDDDAEETRITDDLPDGTPHFRKKEKKKESGEEQQSVMIKIANFITEHGLLITLLTLVIVAPFIYFAATMETSTDVMGMLPKDFEGTKGRDILSEAMSVGDPTPLELIFHNMNRSALDYEVKVQTEILCQELLRLDHVCTIKTTIRPMGIPMFNTTGGPFEDYTHSFVGKNNQTFLLELYLDVSPFAKATEEFIQVLPDNVEEIMERRSLTFLATGEVYYTGLAQALYETKNVTDNAYPVVIPIVIVGVYLVLFFLFGSYFTPIRLIITIAMSIAFTLGLLQLVFSVGFGVPIFWLLPLMLFSILMGLGLDYDIFLVTRIKEYYDKGLSNKQAIAHALDHTATIITSCGIVMAAAYSSLMISKLWHLRELGFAFTIAIILDATIIRIVIVPAIMVLMEKLNWIGPKWLMKKRHQKLPEQD